MTQLEDSGDFGVEETTNHAWKHCDRSLKILKQGDITEQKTKKPTRDSLESMQDKESITATKQVLALLHLAWIQGYTSNPNEITCLNQRDFELS